MSATRTKRKTKSKQTQHQSAKAVPSSGDFKLVDWHGPAQVFRFIGWRDDYSAFFLLDELDHQFVLAPVLVGLQGPVRPEEAPIAITKTRLLPPPCRPRRAEAELLREMRSLAEGRAGDYDEVIQIFNAEATKRKLGPLPPPQAWELIYEDALAPKRDFAFSADNPREDEWHRVEHQLRTEWARKLGWTLEGVEDEAIQFLRRHGSRNPALPPKLAVRANLPLLARVCYKMEFKTLATLWLSSYRLTEPQSTADRDQIRQLLDARPELVRLTPEEAERELGRKPDSKYRKHRTLKDYCSFAGGLDFEKLTRADIPRLKIAQDHFDELRRLGAKRGREAQEEENAAEAVKYGTEYRSNLS